MLAVQGMDDDGGRPCKITVEEVKALVAEANRIYEPARVQFAFRGDCEDFVQLHDTRINSLMAGDRQSDAEKQAPGIGMPKERNQAAAEFAAGTRTAWSSSFATATSRKGPPAAAIPAAMPSSSSCPACGARTWASAAWPTRRATTSA